MWPYYQKNRASTGWDSNLISAYFAGSIGLKKGRLWLIPITNAFRRCSPATRSRLSAKKTHASHTSLYIRTNAEGVSLFVPNPPTMSKQKLDINQTVQHFILSSHLHIWWSCTCCQFLFWYLFYIPLQWAVLDLFASLLAWMSLLSYDLIRWLKCFHPKNSSWLHDFLLIASSF